MNFEGMTNGELSFEVASRLPGDAHFWEESNVELNGKKFDITNPEDAWPVIIENNIIITPRPKNHIGSPRAESWGPESRSSVCDDNSGLLRAAMIVFCKCSSRK